MPWKIKKVPQTTNNLTKAIVNHLLFNGWSASRINTTGIFDEETMSWRKSGSRNGFFDISACIKGRFVAIDVKKGNDRLSEDQIKFMNEVQNAGGMAIEISNYNEFLDWYNKNIDKL